MPLLKKMLSSEIIVAKKTSGGRIIYEELTTFFTFIVNCDWYQLMVIYTIKKKKG